MQTNESEMLIFIVAVLAIFLSVVMVWYNSKYRAKKDKGRDANKEKVVGQLRSFARQNQFRYIAPLQTENKGDSVYLDAVLIGYFGVLGVISLGYNGDIYGKAEDENWVQITSKGERNIFKNPEKESAIALRALRNVLISEKQKNIPVEVVYVFGDKNVQLGIPRSINVMRSKDFKNLLSKDRFLDDCGLDLDAVENAIKKSMKNT